MADFVLSELHDTYEEFQEPLIVVYVNGKKIDGQEVNLMVTHAEIELVSGYEAAMAELTLAGIYDRDFKVFKVDPVKEYILLGSTISISLGYGVTTREVFRGFIARVHFTVGNGTPGVVVTALDIKGSLMSNRHSKRLKARYYSDAVKEILADNALYTAKEGAEDFITPTIDNTPDKPENEAEGPGAGAGAGGEKKTDDRRVEMVEESDYEFIVKAAKKFNFEFFTVGRNLYFVEARKNETPLIELSVGMGINSLDVGYDITGLVREVNVRNVDSDQGDFVGKTTKLNSSISMGNKAKPFVDKQSFVYIDPTAQSKEDAEYRANYLSSMMDYRLGSLRANTRGLPELVPGRFFTLKEMGKPVDNNFYITKVKHTVTMASFHSEIEACVNQIGK